MVPKDPKCQWDTPVTVGVPSNLGSSVSEPVIIPVLKFIVRIDIFSS